MLFSSFRTLQQAREAFPHLKEGGKLTGVIELVLNGSRFKVRVNELKCQIIFLLSGIRCLPNDKNMPNFEVWSGQALNYSKKILM